MKISYVLPVHNAQTDLVFCLDSILENKGDDELIVINDGSTDKTGEVLATYKKRIDIIHTIKERKGGAYARNVGNAKATGDIIAVCDCDIYYADRGKVIKEFFRRFKRKSIFYSALHLRNKNDGMRKYLQEAMEWDFNSKCPISHPTVAYRKSVADKIKYKELSVETDLYEFFLLDAHREGFKFNATQMPLMMKVEGTTIRSKKDAWKVKNKLYKEYGIKIKGAKK